MEEVLKSEEREDSKRTPADFGNNEGKTIIQSGRSLSPL
jgi:hypothetical protein